MTWVWIILRALLAGGLAGGLVGLVLIRLWQGSWPWRRPARWGRYVIPYKKDR